MLNFCAFQRGRKTNVTGTSNADFINKHVLKVSLFPQSRGKRSVYNESSEYVQCRRGWRCRHTPNPTGLDFMRRKRSQKQWKMLSVPKIYSFMGEELRDLAVAVRSNCDATEQQDERSAPPSHAHCPENAQVRVWKMCEVVMAAAIRDRRLELGGMREKTQSVGKRHSPGTKEKHLPEKRDPPCGSSLPCWWCLCGWYF